MNFISPCLTTPFTITSQLSRRYSRVAGQTLIVGVNAVFFAGKLTPQAVPSFVTRTALLSLNGISLVFIPYTADLFLKVMSDAYQGKKMGAYGVALLTSFKALELFSSLGLIVAGFIAAAAGWAQRNEIQKDIYKGMVPIGELALILGIILNIAYIFLNRATLKKMEVLLKPQSEEIEMESLTLSQSPLQEFYAQGLLNSPFGCQIKACMDKDTFYQLYAQMEALSLDDLLALKEVLEVIKKNIETQQINFGGQLALILLAEPLMALEKYKPNSLLSASINLTVSSAYLLKYLIETLREIWQRQRLTDIIRSEST